MTARPVRSIAAVVLLAAVLLAGCSGSSSSTSTSTTAAASDPCRAGYQAAASRLNGVARYFSQAAQNGQMNEQFAGFASDYVQAMKTFDTTVSALPCTGAAKDDLTQLVAAQVVLEPLVAQFAAGQRPEVAEFNAAAGAVADAVRRVNAALGIS
jgi:hypothetical protein